jgi:N-acetylglucosaminyl-diphospho-decaprenol L-rhamnosyltransferase
MRRGPWKNTFSNHRLIRQHLMMDWDHKSLRAVDWGLGAAMMIRRAAAGQELFDERYFLYFEDVDLCFRIHKSGWKVLYNPDAGIVHHHLRESANVFSLRAKGHHFLSMVKYLWKQRSELKEMRCDEEVD